MGGRVARPGRCAGSVAAKGRRASPGRGGRPCRPLRRGSGFPAQPRTLCWEELDRHCCTCKPGRCSGFFFPRLSRFSVLQPESAPRKQKVHCRKLEKRNQCVRQNLPPHICLLKLRLMIGTGKRCRNKVRVLLECFVSRNKLSAFLGIPCKFACLTLLISSCNYTCECLWVCAPDQRAKSLGRPTPQFKPFLQLPADFRECPSVIQLLGKAFQLPMNSFTKLQKRLFL